MSQSLLNFQRLNDQRRQPKRSQQVNGRLVGSDEMEGMSMVKADSSCHPAFEPALTEPSGLSVSRS